ncbi:MAG TPA: ABC transporter substrate-binding protein, partial [Jiangellales bacterium]|nr:ABC transporter substrate-binding protein [Jiangellales bacterium]
MKRLVITAAVSAVALAAAACGSDDPATGGEFAAGATFTMVLGSDPGNLDPHFTSLATALQAGEFLYDSLISVDIDGNVVANLAEEWESTTTSATFTLREGITCSDGTPLTASVVAENITFVGDPENASSRMGVFVPPMATATGDDDTRTVEVTSPAPDPFLERNVGSLPIVCAKGMEDRDLLAEGADGTGMFTVTEAVANDHYTLTRRTDYAWGPGDWDVAQAGLPDTVVLRVVNNETTSANLLLSKEVNVATIVGPDQQRLQQLFHREVVAPLGLLWFNQKAGLPTQDEAVRRALAQALDLAALGQVLTSGTGIPATALVGSGGPCSQATVPGNLPETDVDEATSSLDSAGWTAGADGVRAKGGQPLALEIYVASSLGTGSQAAAELMQQTWGEIGAEVTLRAVTDAEVGQLVVGGQGSWAAMILPLTVSVPTQLVPFLSGPTPPDGVNFA